jgi:hypothetical protein
MPENKAIIRNLDTKEEIKCLFNPNQYTFSKHNNWSPKQVQANDVPLLQFSGGNSTTLSMQLFFDTSLIGKDVRDVTKGVWKLMKIDKTLTNKKDEEKGIYRSEKGRPPTVAFHWGGTWSFNAVITDLKQTLTLFREDGTPVRATMDVTFMQVGLETGDFPGQNPTTVGRPGYKRRVVKEGDTIDWIAFEEYGDSSMWRTIAETNELDDPRMLRPGQILSISPPS